MLINNHNTFKLSLKYSARFLIAVRYTGKNFRFLINTFFLLYFNATINNPKKILAKIHFWPVARQITEKRDFTIRRI